jgi:hypothetical protein
LRPGMRERESERETSEICRLQEREREKKEVEWGN